MRVTVPVAIQMCEIEVRSETYKAITDNVIYGLEAESMLAQMVREKDPEVKVLRTWMEPEDPVVSVTRVMNKRV